MGFCGWADVNERNKVYHDNEWGVPVHDDRNMFGEENLPIETSEYVILKRVLIWR